MTSTQTQIRRDTAANLDAATPATGELGYDITNKQLRLGDGSTLGGIRVPNANNVQQNTFTYAVAGGTANALTLTLAPAFQSYASGAGCIFKASATNTGSATINVNSLGVRTMQKVSGGALVDLVAGDIVNGGLYQLLYDGTVFQIQGLSAPTSDSGLVLLETVTGGGSTYDFTEFSSDYDNYLFVLQEVINASSPAILTIRTSSDGGSSFSAGGSDYIDTVGSSSAIRLMNSTSSFIISGEVKAFNINSTAHVKQFIMHNNVITGTTLSDYVRSGLRNSSAAINAVRFLFDTGNITSGTIRMYGYKI
jgi:hypothetical protein